MAGTNPDFDAADFRDKMRFVFGMAAPTEVADRAKFFFRPTIDPEDPTLGPDGVPFDPAEDTSNLGAAPVTVTCSIEAQPAADENTRLGSVRPSKISVTLLDEEYAQVRGCWYVVVGGERYDYVATDPPSALFDVGLWTMHFKIFKDL